MKLHNIATWEKFFPTKQIEHVYYTSDMLVRKVTGYITVTRRTLMNGMVTNIPGENVSDGMDVADVTTSTTITDCVIMIFTLPTEV